MNYHGRKFKPFSVSSNGEVSESVVFHYKQEGLIVTCNYAGGSIEKGHLIGRVSNEGIIDMRYHQVLRNGLIQTGTCVSTPEVLKNGKIRLHERWKWTSGDLSEGKSILEEI